MAIIDTANVLSDGAGHAHVLDMLKPTTGGHNNLNGWINVRTSGTQGSIQLQESDNNSDYSAVTDGTISFTAAGSKAFPLPKTTKRYLKVVFSAESGDNLSSSNTCVWVGGISEAKELA